MLIAYRKDESRVADRLSIAWTVGDDRRLPIGQRLKDGIGEALAPRRHDKYVGCGQQVGHVAALPQKPCLRSTAREKLAGTRPLPGYQQFDPRILLMSTADGCNQCHWIFAPLELTGVKDHDGCVREAQRGSGSSPNLAIRGDRQSEPVADHDKFRAQTRGKPVELVALRERDTDGAARGGHNRRDAEDARRRVAPPARAAGADGARAA